MEEMNISTVATVSFEVKMGSYAPMQRTDKKPLELKNKKKDP